MNFYLSRLLTQATPPAAEPLTLAEAKLYLRVDNDEEDTQIGSLIISARAIAERYLGRSLITQDWLLALNDQVPSGLCLPRGPVTAVNSVTSYDRAGAPTAISNGSYYLDASNEVLVFESLVSAHRVEIIYTAGYGEDADDVPAPIRQGMLSHIAQMYERRGDAESAMPPEAIALYAPFREARI